MNDKSSEFDANYYEHFCGLPYERNGTWMHLFYTFAQKIKAEINPGTALDAGCAMGFLVESLRKEGIAAEGIDISEYAIQKAHESIKPFVRVSSILEPFPKKYDLIVTIEVLEHLSKADGEKAVENLCQFTDDILFSSHPFLYEETTHYNVQPPDYWAEQFAHWGFFRDVDFDASFITPWAVRFRRRNEPIHRIIRDYERKFWPLIKENIDLRKLANETRLEISELKLQSGQPDEKKALEEKIKQLNDQLQVSEERWQDLQRGTLYRILIKIQSIRVWLIPLGSARERWWNKLIKKS